MSHQLVNILTYLSCVLYHTNYNVQAMFHHVSSQTNLLPNLQNFLLNNLNPTFNIFYTDQLSQISFAEIICELTVHVFLRLFNYYVML